MWVALLRSSPMCFPLFIGLSYVVPSCPGRLPRGSLCPSLLLRGPLLSVAHPMWFPLAQVISHVFSSFPVFSYVPPLVSGLILCGSLLPRSSSQVISLELSEYGAKHYPSHFLGCCHVPLFVLGPPASDFWSRFLCPLVLFSFLVCQFKERTSNVRASE